MPKLGANLEFFVCHLFVIRAPFISWHPPLYFEWKKKLAPGPDVSGLQHVGAWGTTPVVGAHHWVITMTRGQLEAR